MYNVTQLHGWVDLFMACQGQKWDQENKHLCLTDWLTDWLTYHASIPNSLPDLPYLFIFCLLSEKEISNFPSSSSRDPVACKETIIGRRRKRIGFFSIDILDGQETRPIVSFPKKQWKSTGWKMTLQGFRKSVNPVFCLLSMQVLYDSI